VLKKEGGEMKTIKDSPKNKIHFIRLKKFVQEILDILKELKIKPVLWGGLAYFAYTKNRNYIIKDIDFLIPDKSIKKVMKILKEKKIKYKYLPDWHSLIVSKRNLRIEFDPIERYYKWTKNFNKFNFNGLILKVVKLKDLIKMYEYASKVSQDKPKQHFKRLNELKKLKE